MLPLAGDLAGTLVVEDDQALAGLRDALEAQDSNRHARARRLDALPSLVEQRPDATGVDAADEAVSDLERAVGDQDRRHGAHPPVQLRLDHRATSR